jgi:hypothetical protein
VAAWVRLYDRKYIPVNNSRTIKAVPPPPSMVVEKIFETHLDTRF